MISSSPGAGHFDVLAHVAHDLVGHEDDGHPVALGEIEGLHRHREALPDARRAQRDDGLVAVAAPADLHDVRLGRPGRQPRAGACALHVDNHAGHLAHDGKPQVLLHQRKPRAACGRERLRPGQRGADHGGDRCDLVFHLDVDAAQLRQLSRTLFGDFGGRRDRVAGVEPGAGVDRPFRDGLIALH